LAKVRRKHGPLRIAILIACLGTGLHAQDSASPPPPPSAPPPPPALPLVLAPLAVATPPLPPAPETEPKRLFGLLPNNHTSNDLDGHYTPLTPREKLRLTNLDAFDRSTFIDAAIFGGMGQWHRDNASFGNGIPAYAHYFATSAADFMIGDYMTEAVFPVLLHQDPRFFRRGTGSFLARLRPAITQIFWTRMDSGGMNFNYSEVVGNAAAVAISQAYYPDNRHADTAARNLGVQIGVDMAGNIIKEFSPELRRAFLPKHHVKDPVNP
jgi:hypothetical protein